MGFVRKTWRVTGMHCPRCEDAVRRALADAGGLREIVVSYPNGTLAALWDADALPETEIGRRLREAGYDLQRNGGAEPLLQGIARFALAVAAAVFMLVMALNLLGGFSWLRRFTLRLPKGMSAMVSGLALAGIGVVDGKTEQNGYAVVEGEAQFVRSELEFGGYPTITVRAGVPAEWTIHADTSRINGCNNEIYIPAFNLSVPLEAGDNVIRFTAEESGEIPYTCWMSMMHGTIHVTDG